MYLNFEAKIRENVKKVDEELIDFINSSKKICEDFCSDMAELDKVRKSLVDDPYPYMENLIVDKEIEKRVQMARDQFWECAKFVKRAFTGDREIDETVAEVALKQFEDITLEHYFNSITRESDTDYVTRVARVDHFMWELQKRVLKLITGAIEAKD